MKRRSLRSLLEKHYRGDDLKKYLVTGLCKNHVNANEESMYRKVREWFKREDIPNLKKNDAIELAFILGLNYEEADDLVISIIGEKLHWRSTEEIVYIYGLNNSLSYLETIALAEELKDVLPEGNNNKDSAEKDQSLFMRKEIDSLKNPEELKAYIIESGNRLTGFHNRAFKLFEDMLLILKEPVDQTEEELFGEGSFREKVAVRNIIVPEYLFRDNKLHLERKEELKEMYKQGQISKEDYDFLNRIKKEFFKYWPDETTISKMKNRNIDITRNVLILLFLATDESDDEDNMTKEEFFENIHIRIDIMLDQCGFLPLDPRCPFDWLILFCFAAGNIFETDPEMREMFINMFGENNEKR